MFQATLRWVFGSTAYRFYKSFICLNGGDPEPFVIAREVQNVENSKARINIIRKILACKEFSKSFFLNSMDFTFEINFTV